MELGDQIKAAMGAHGLWKTRLRTAIETGMCDFSVAIVKRDDQCAFGKWLHGDDIGAPVKQSPEHARCVDLHRRFHVQTASVLSLALEGRKADALKAMEINSEFAQISGALTLHLMEWQAAYETRAA